MKVNKKKLISLLLCVSMLISNFAYATENGTEMITRGELAKLVNSTFSFTELDKKPYKDVKADSLYYTDLLIAKKVGYFPVKSGDKLVPEGRVSRQEMAYILKTVLDQKKKSNINPLKQLKDSNEIASWSKEAVSFVLSKRLMDVGPGKKFTPKGIITKNEANEILKHCLSVTALILDKPGKFKGGSVRGSVLIDSPNVLLENTVIYGDLIIGKAVGDGDVKLLNVTVRGTTIVNGGGMNTVTVENCDFKNLKVMKLDNKIRILAKGSTRIANTEMSSGGKLEESELTGEGFGWVVLSETIDNGAEVSLVGSYENVEIIGDGLNVTFSGGTVEALTVSNAGTNTKIDIGIGELIKALTLNAKSIVGGLGKVGTVSSNVEGSSINVSNYQGTGTSNSGTSLPASVNGGGAGTTGGTTGNSAAGGANGGSSGGSGRNNGSGTGGAGGPSLTAITGVLDIQGTPIIGNVLTAGNITPTGATTSYQWQQSSTLTGTYSNISGATGGTYTLTNTDLNKYIRLMVTGTGSYTGTVYSKSTVAVTADPDIAAVEADKSTLTEALIKGGNSSLSKVTSSLAVLPTIGINGSSITWSSNMLALVSNDGQTVVRPAYGTGDKTVELKAIISKGKQTTTITFSLVVLTELLEPSVAIVLDKDALTEDLIKGSNESLSKVTTALAKLPTVGANGSTISWTSDKPEILSADGQTILRPMYLYPSETVTLNATLKKGSFTESKSFTLTVIPGDLASAQKAIQADDLYLRYNFSVGDNVDNKHVIHPFSLPSKGPNRCTYTWKSSRPDILSADGLSLHRPAFGVPNCVLVITAHVKYGSFGDLGNDFAITVLAETEEETRASLVADKDTLTEALLKGSNESLSKVTTSLAKLPTEGTNGSTISWATDATATLSDDGQTIVRPAYNASNKTVNLTATLKKGSLTETKSFTIIILRGDKPLEIVAIEADKDYIYKHFTCGENTDMDHITKPFALPTTAPNGSTVTWVSDEPSVLSNDGLTLHRPPFGSANKDFSIIANFKNGSYGEGYQLLFPITVLAETENPDTSFVEADKAALTDTLLLGTNKNLSQVVNALAALPSTGANGSAITWSSDKTGTLSSDGQTVNRPGAGSSPETVILTATLVKGSVTRTKDFTVTVLPIDYIPVVGNWSSEVASPGMVVGVTPNPHDANVIYQWQRADGKLGSYVDIPGATGSNYCITTEDLGKYIRNAVTGTGKYYGTAYSAGAYASTDGSKFKTTYEGSDTVITGVAGTIDTKVYIPSVIYSDTYTKIGDGALKNCGITEITMISTLKMIGTEAFQGNSLTKITIGPGVTIGENLLCGDNGFRDAYLAGGAGTYVGTQNGTWTKQP